MITNEEAEKLYDDINVDKIWILGYFDCCNLIIVGCFDSEELAIQSCTEEKQFILPVIKNLVIDENFYPKVLYWPLIPNSKINCLKRWNIYKNNDYSFKGIEDLNWYQSYEE